MGFENISVNWFKYSEAHMESPTTCAPPAGSWGRTPRIRQDTSAFLIAPFCTNRTTPKPQQNTTFPSLFPAQPCTATTCHTLSIILRNTFPHPDLEEASLLSKF